MFIFCIPLIIFIIISIFLLIYLLQKNDPKNPPSALLNKEIPKFEVKNKLQAAIADDAVDEARLQVSNTGTNGYALTYQSGNTGKLTWAEMTAGVTKASSTPSVAAEGTLFYNTTQDVLYFSNGSAWVPLSNATPTTTGGTVTIPTKAYGDSQNYNLGP